MNSNSRNKNPFELPVEAQIAAFRRANDQEGWGITDEDINLLTESAPVWPTGRFAFRSLRIRFGEGDAGVVRTFQAHIKRGRAVFHHRYWPLPDNCLPTEGQMQLLAGNGTHRQTVEWVVFDLRSQLIFDRSPVIFPHLEPGSPADELLVFMWMFPEFTHAYRGTNLRICAGGYRLVAPNWNRQIRQSVVIVEFVQRDDAPKVCTYEPPVYNEEYYQTLIRLDDDGI